MNPAYVGRFAPSPTGPLHLGSLLAALASYLDARAHGGQWLVRIDDIDPPRAQSGATEAILNALAAHELRWDGQVVMQSEHRSKYDAALESLYQTHQAFACSCSRTTLRSTAKVYPGTCRKKGLCRDGDVSLRLRVDETAVVHFDDLKHGRQIFDRPRLGGDFVIRRRDRHIAYQLACAVDDGGLGISDVVRGADLLESTGRQIHVMHCLNLAPPRYLHIPVLTDAQGAKLSKQNLAPPLDCTQAHANLIRSLAYLGQPIPPDNKHKDCGRILAWACAHWSRERIPHEPQQAL